MDSVVEISSGSTPMSHVECVEVKGGGRIGMPRCSAIWRRTVAPHLWWGLIWARQSETAGAGGSVIAWELELVEMVELHLGKKVLLGSSGSRCRFL